MDDNRNPSWPPFQPSTDCSQGYCSIYCPQWCYFLFPPPPPTNPSGNTGSGQTLSPFVIALIALASAALVLIGYYIIIYRYCQRRRRHPATDPPSTATATAASAAATGLDDALISKITVCRYRRGDGLIGGTNCSVCLSEFQDDETLRLLPKCSHAFHVPCIDMWLKSHPNCPLCRAGIIWASPPPAATVGSEGNRPMTEIEHTHEVEVVVLQDSRTSLGHNNDASKNGEGSREEDGATPMNGSLSVERSRSIDHERGSSGALLPI